jgi:hypothetical protein
MLVAAQIELNLPIQSTSGKKYRLLTSSSQHSFLGYKTNLKRVSEAL